MEGIWGGILNRDSFAWPGQQEFYESLSRRLVDKDFCLDAEPANQSRHNSQVGVDNIMVVGREADRALHPRRLLTGLG